MSDNNDDPAQLSFTFEPDDSARLDPVYAAFLSDLDDADHIDLTDWEAVFVGGLLTTTTFTPKQRECIERLRDKYGRRL